MKVSQLVELDMQLQKELQDDDTCGLCALHEAGYRQLKNEFICPHCGKSVPMTYKNGIGEYNVSVDNFVVVGDWYGDMDEEIRKLPVIQCVECDKEFVLAPYPVFHNYNHGVYYLGKKKVIPNFNENDLANKIQPTVQEYLDRYKTGEVSVENLCLWLARDIESHVRELIDNCAETFKI